MTIHSAPGGVAMLTHTEWLTYYASDGLASVNAVLLCQRRLNTQDMTNVCVTMVVSA